MRFRHVDQASLELLTSDDPPTSASQSAGITHEPPRLALATFCICIFYLLFLFIYLFLRQSLTLSPKLECSGMISTHCSHRLPGSSNSPASVSQAARITSVYHRTWLIFTFLVEMVSPCWPRLVWNSRAQEILPPWPPKVLESQA